MRKIILTLFLVTLALATGCSKDDMATIAPKAEVRALAAKAPAKSLVKCIDPERIELNCTSADKNAPITFKWDNKRVSYAFNRVYKSYLQIESDACSDVKTQPVSIPIHFFSSTSHTLTEGRDETCFKYRVVILGFDKGEQACESILPWQEFDYSKQQDSIQQEIL
jgi:hypothetical protein